MNHKPLRDAELLSVVFMILAVNASILVCWQLGWPFRVERTTVDSTVSDDLFVVTTYLNCVSENQMVFTGMLLGLQVGF